MAHIDGIGGVFIYSNNPKRLAEWYIKILGLTLEPLEDDVYYIELYYRSLVNSEKKLHTVFAIMPEKETMVLPPHHHSWVIPHILEIKTTYIVKITQPIGLHK